ncbi:GntR family transcriptional regulator [Plantactinospora endophytica]|uniref:HTH gntR-type domain-containing protein n=1 Tax=Plantactinospora endophytica TaxID=673535 RepID=A0ABQ4E2F0_9ACTN|nr:GntR family transcriptional regulator [Plantactinospora endophytica]GIG88879.1 hypothetical protein Pen02_38150 [Plantactinospora endophytica]
MASAGDGRPRHEQIAADIRARIMAGGFPPGTQLPSIPTLVATYHAATATIQRALGALKAEGSVYSETGRGVYVRDRQPLVVDAVAYITPAHDGYEYRLINVAEVVPPTEVAQALGSGGDLAVLRHRLLLQGNEPVELSWSYYPATIARGTELAGRRKITGGAARVLADNGQRQRDLHDRISARMPTTEEVEALALPPYVPVIRQFRVVRAESGRPVEVSILIKGSHLHELQYRQAIPSES